LANYTASSVYLGAAFEDAKSAFDAIG